VFFLLQKGEHKVSLIRTHFADIPVLFDTWIHRNENETVWCALQVENWSLPLWVAVKTDIFNPNLFFKSLCKIYFVTEIFSVHVCNWIMPLCVLF